MCFEFNISMAPSMNEVYEYILSIQKGLGGGKYGYLLIMIDGCEAV